MTTKYATYMNKFEAAETDRSLLEEYHDQYDPEDHRHDDPDDVPTEWDACL